MQTVHDGQCGLCAHFGEHHGQTPELLQIRTRQQAPESYVDDCGHPRNAPLHLKVTAVRGCVGFVPAR